MVRGNNRDKKSGKEIKEQYENTKSLLGGRRFFLPPLKMGEKGNSRIESMNKK